MLLVAVALVGVERAVCSSSSSSSRNKFITRAFWCLLAALVVLTIPCFFLLRQINFSIIWQTMFLPGRIEISLLLLFWFCCNCCCCSCCCSYQCCGFCCCFMILCFFRPELVSPTYRLHSEDDADRYIASFSDNTPLLVKHGVMAAKVAMWFLPAADTLILVTVVTHRVSTVHSPQKTCFCQLTLHTLICFVLSSAESHRLVPQAPATTTAAEAGARIRSSSGSGPYAWYVQSSIIHNLS